MLHLTNGEATASLLRLAEVPGEVRSVDDILMEGPLRNGLASPADVAFRAAWLQKRLGIPKGDYLSHAGRRSKWARETTDREVVLWSEEDLFCQVNLADLLVRLRAARVLLVTPAKDEDRIGATPLAEVPALLDARREVTPARKDAAGRFWRAMCSSDPREVEAIARGAPTGWPSLARGAQLHLQRFPSTTNGLSLLEATLLRALAKERLTFAQLFALTQEEPLAGYGMGDVQALAALRGMAQGEKPLVFCDDPRALDEAKAEGAWGATELGLRVAEGKADAVDERGIDTWLGGVELVGASAAWRYDPGTRALRESLSTPSG